MNLYTIIIKDCGEHKFGAIHEMLIRRREHINKEMLKEIVHKCMEYGETVSKNHHVSAQIFRDGALIMSVAYASLQHYYPVNRITYNCDLLRINRQTWDIDRCTLRKGVMAE